MQHFIKGYGIYINLDNFTFKLAECIATPMCNLLHSRDSITKIRYSYFSFDEVSLTSQVTLPVTIFNVRVILVEANGYRSHLDLSNSPFA